jgi:hypothetical protein
MTVMTEHSAGIPRRLNCPQPLIYNSTIVPEEKMPPMFCYRWMNISPESIVTAMATAAAVLQLVIGSK